MFQSEELASRLAFIKFMLNHQMFDANVPFIKVSKCLTAVWTGVLIRHCRRLTGWEEIPSQWLGLKMDDGAEIIHCGTRPDIAGGMPDFLMAFHIHLASESNITLLASILLSRSMTPKRKGKEKSPCQR
jgi:hypothetical protein